jgi:hypothetical protein
MTPIARTAVQERPLSAVVGMELKDTSAKTANIPLLLIMAKKLRCYG